MTTAHNNLVVCLCRGITLGRIVRGGRGSVATTRILVPPPPPASASASASAFSSSSLCLHNLINNNNNKTRKGFFCSPIMSQTDNLSSDSASAGFPTASFQNGGVTAAFALSPSTLLKINKGDITRWSVDSSSDAIVNPANERMLGGGGADGAIHRAAGPELLDACYNVPEVQPGMRCPTGEARITPGFKLPASHVIHTVGPIYSVDRNPEASLRNAYRNSLTVAKDNNIKYIAFPAISCGVYGYPFDEAAAVAISAVKEFANDIKEVHFVLFSDDIYSVWLNKAKELLQA